MKPEGKEMKKEPRRHRPRSPHEPRERGKSTRKSKKENQGGEERFAALLGSKVELWKTETPVRAVRRVNVQRNSEKSVSHTTDSNAKHQRNFQYVKVSSFDVELAISIRQREARSLSPDILLTLMQVELLISPHSHLK